MRHWRLVQRLAYLGFIVAWSEVSLQAFYYATTGGGLLFSRVSQPQYAPEAFGGFRNRPNLTLTHSTNEFHVTMVTNSEGFRVSPAREEYAIPKDPHTFRIMLLGPSFAFGWGVNWEDSFAARLAPLLRAGGYADGRPIELINAGVCALGPAQQLEWYKHLGRAFAPDLVIQFIYGSMAVHADRTSPYRVTEDGYLLPRDGGPGRELRHTLKKFGTVFYGWLLYTRMRQALAGRERDRTVEGAGRPLSIHGPFDPREAGAKEALRFYHRLRTTVETDGAHLVVVYFPLSYSVHPQDVSRWRHLGVRDIGTQIAFDRAFSSFLEARGFEVLNLTQDLIEAARENPERLYYWLDIHWTRRGNRVAAESTARWLLRRDLAKRADARVSSIVR